MTAPSRLESPTDAARDSYDVERAREEFPILSLAPHGRPLVYLDNAATTQKPESVIEAVSRYYREENANIHRGVHFLSERATAAYERVRAQVAAFLGAARAEEIVFVRGTTEAVNLVANAYGTRAVSEGDEILITGLEHHSNIVPWQLLCERTGAALRVAEIDDSGTVTREAFESQLSSRTRIVAMAHVSNALGTVVPVKEFTALARERADCVVMIDGAQAASRLKVDVRELGCDFYAISGHKAYGPTGVGALYGRFDRLEAMDPYMGGGEMIASVSFEGTTYNRVPHKFEAGTPNIAGTIGLGAAIAYIETLGLDAIARHEDDVLRYATERIGSIPGVRLVGTSSEKAGILGFVVDGAHPHDIGTILDQEGIAVRAGHHCAQPVMDRLGVPATVRASFALYNTRTEVDALAEGIEKVKEFFD